MAISRYELDGAPGFPQVEPASGFWLRCPILRTIELSDLRAAIDSKVQPFTSFDEAEELARLQQLFDKRMKPVPSLSRLLSHDIFFEPPPAGAVLSRGSKGIANGVELATLFEAETPGLWHRHVLNVILDPSINGGAAQTLSPPRQALIWAALDVAIASALSAAWHYKWIAEGKTDVDYRRRPVEYVVEQNETSKEPVEFTVLYDLAVERDGSGRIIREKPKSKGPKPSPGTPRHPAYPSGHSTYSAAASHVLACLFDGYKDPRPALATVDWGKEFERLGDNIGVARFYGGVHWESDHTLGVLVGNAVGDLVVKQLNESGIPVRPRRQTEPPKPDDLQNQATQFSKNCGNGRANFCQGVAGADQPIQQVVEIL